MKEILTVSDSKKLFHEKFPYVIPGLYKTIVDELLVELNLLSHQSDFSLDYLFCFGLTEIFKELMKDYNPEEHLDLLFDSLCSSSNFDSKKIKETSKKSLQDLKNKSSKDIQDLLKDKSRTNHYPSRILNLGVYITIANSTDFEGTSESKKNKIISDIFVNLNLPVKKAEKEIGIYKASIKKMAQAKELLEELKIKNKKQNK